MFLSNLHLTFKQGNFIIIILVVLFFTLIGCNSNNENKIDDNDLFSADIDTIFQIDSTYIKIQTIAQNLNVAWEIIYGPDDWIWITEQSGGISRIDPRTGEKITLLEIPEVIRRRSTGLLGMVLHPEFEQNPHLFVNYTYKDSQEIRSNLVRYTYEEDSLHSPKFIFEVDGNTGHNGSRVKISRDMKLLWATGDAHQPENAQNPETPNGKILRLNLDGSIPDDNPYKDNPVYSWGHRNHQGLVVTDQHIYTSEHGAATDDEVNLIKPTGNYGWPDIEGYVDTPSEQEYARDSVIVPPMKAWTPTIAPAGMEYYGSTKIPQWHHSLLLTTLKENDLRILKLNDQGDRILSEQIMIDQQYGRLRDVTVSPSGDVYVSTSNRDWNPGEGYPKPEDDRILRLSLATEKEVTAYRNKMAAGASSQTSSDTGSDPTLAADSPAGLYTMYCASCHKEDGKGVENSFPPLLGNDSSVADKYQLIKIALEGLDPNREELKAEYEGSMPGFAFLSDQELADILTYIRTSFGNSFEAISPEDIAELRAELEVN